MFRYAFTISRKQRRWRVSCALLISGLLHLFALLAYERWAAENVEKILHPVRFQVVPPALPTDPFKSTPPILPLTQLERRMSEQPPADPLADAEIIDQITPLAEKPDSILTLREPRFMGEKSAEFEAVRDTFISLEDLPLEMERQRAEEKAGYVRRWMLDADTTDADSRNKKKAEEIVDRAIEAMGGMDRLLQSAHVIQVDDRKYGFLREAYFSPSSHLLIAEKQHGVLTRVEEYRTVDGIKTPYEVRRYFRRFATRYRFNTRFNTGLESSFFDDPGERTWDSNSMVALLGVQADSTMRVALNEITQILTTPRDDVIDYESRRLLDAYLGKKLKSAGVLGDASSRYNVEVTVKGYYLDRRASIYTINFHLVVADKESTKPLLDHIVSHRWKSTLFPPIDQSIAERLTSMLVKSIGHALSSKNGG